MVVYLVEVPGSLWSAEQTPTMNLSVRAIRYHIGEFMAVSNPGSHQTKQATEEGLEKDQNAL